MVDWPRDCRALIRRTEHSYSDGARVWEVRALYTARYVGHAGWVEVRRVAAVVAERPTWVEAMRVAQYLGGW